VEKKLVAAMVLIAALVSVGVFVGFVGLSLNSANARNPTILNTSSPPNIGAIDNGTLLPNLTSIVSTNNTSTIGLGQDIYDPAP